MIARLASLVVRFNLLKSPGSPGLNPQCCDVTRPWAQECRALLPPHSSPFCQDERPLSSSPANRQIMKNLLCPLPFSLLSFCKARWETSCDHSWQTISDIALSQKPAAGQYLHFPLSSGSLTTLLWVEYFTKTSESLITLLQKPALSNQEHITQSTCLLITLLQKPALSNQEHITHFTCLLITLLQKPALSNQEHITHSTCPLATLPQNPVLGNQEHTMLFNLLNHRSPYCNNLLWAIHNKNSLTQYSFCNHPAAEICSGQLSFTLHFYILSLSTLLQKSAPGHWIKNPNPSIHLHLFSISTLCFLTRNLYPNTCCCSTLAWHNHPIGQRYNIINIFLKPSPLCLHPGTNFTSFTRQGGHIFPCNVAITFSINDNPWKSISVWVFLSTSMNNIKVIIASFLQDA